MDIRLELPGCAPVISTAFVVDRARGARVARAVTALFICGVCAVPFVFIPLLHFVLVPAWMGAGVLLFVLRLRDDCTLVEVQGACPHCKVQRTFVTSGRFADGRTIHCDGCGARPYLRVT